MKLHRFTGSVLFIALFIFAAAAKADDLTGTSLSGAITGHGTTSVTAQFTSPAVVGAGVEFTGSVHEGFFSEDFNISADFGSDDLTVVFSSAITTSNIESPSDLLSLSFSGFPLSFSGFSAVSYSCDSSLGTVVSCDDASSGLSSATYSGSTLTLNFDSIFSGDTYVFSSRSTAPTPEPSTFVFLGTGVLSLGGVLRRRLAKVS